MPRTSLHISYLLFLKGLGRIPNEGLPHWQRGSATDQWTARAQVRCMVKLMSIRAREIKGEHQRCTVVLWNDSQQALRRIDDEAQHDKVEVEPSMAFWDSTQGETEWTGQRKT